LFMPAFSLALGKLKKIKMLDIWMTKNKLILNYAEI
jgi:hypothetical protein